MDNYQSVIHQMEQFGVELISTKDLPLTIPTPKRKTCGKGGKYWYWLQLWRPRDREGRETGATLIVGKFGTYKHHGKEQKVELDFQPPTKEERERFIAQLRAAEEASRREKAEAAALAALTAGQVWKGASVAGESPYLVRKGVEPESCRFVQQTVYLQRRDPDKAPLVLPPGTLVIPLIRYDMPRAKALRGLQFIKPDGFKFFTEDLAKTGCAVRLGQVEADTWVVMVCEGYATGLSIRKATGRRWPVFVALDAYNLMWVVEILRAVYPKVHLLVCADDDWKTADHEGANPGRKKALLAARTTTRCDIVWPVFDPAVRQEKDTDFNDLHQREGLEAVERQLLRVLTMIEEGIAARGA